MVIDITAPEVEPLTRREMQVLGLISRGLSNREIAEELVVTPGTVKWYNKQIYHKLGVNSRTKAIAQANKAGLFDQSIEITSIPGVAYENNLPAPITSFIEREHEILALIAQGFSNSEIAEQLHISLKTVHNHVSNIYNKMQVTNRVQAVLRAREAGLGIDKSDNQSQP